MISRFPGSSVYKLTQALPFAYAVSQAVLSDVQAGELKPSDVTPLHSKQIGPNSLSVTAVTPEGDNWIVIMTSYYPGWRVIVDGREAEMKNVGEFLAVQAKPGNHTYVFEFDPPLVKVAFAISLLALIVTIGWLIGLERIPFWQSVMRRFPGMKIAMSEPKPHGSKMPGD